LNEDELLRAVAQIARSERADELSGLEERWRALCAGELPEEEERRLHELAASSPEHARALEAYAPLEERFRDDMVRLLLPADHAETRRNDPAGARSRWSWWSFPKLRAVVLLPAAAVAVLALVLLLPRGGLPPLPSYSAELHGGVQQTRAAGVAEPEMPRLVDGSILTLVLRPSTAVEGRLAVRCLLVHGDEVLERRLPLEIAETGAVRVEAELGRDLVLEPGPWQLVAVVSRPGATPGAGELEALALADEPGRGESWAATRVSFIVASEPPEHGSPAR
jgi:hypothetical protein